MEKEKFEKLIAKGKMHFIFYKGMLGWGVPAAFLFTLLEHKHGVIPFWEALSIGLIVFPIGGILFALLAWFVVNQAYKHHDFDLRDNQSRLEI